jgi:hypothetical protein
MNLLGLAPDIQEEILFLPATERGQDLVREKQVREVVNQDDNRWDLVRKH